MQIGLNDRSTDRLGRGEQAPGGLGRARGRLRLSRGMRIICARLGMRQAEEVPGLVQRVAEMRMAAGERDDVEQVALVAQAVIQSIGTQLRLHLKPGDLDLFAI